MFYKTFPCVSTNPFLNISDLCPRQPVVAVVVVSSQVVDIVLREGVPAKQEEREVEINILILLIKWEARVQ